MAERNYQSYIGPTDPNLRHSEVEGYQPVSRIGLRCGPGPQPLANPDSPVHRAAQVRWSSTRLVRLAWGARGHDAVLDMASPPLLGS